jgi:hypothetical protein
MDHAPLAGPLCRLLCRLRPEDEHSGGRLASIDRARGPVDCVANVIESGFDVAVRDVLVGVAEEPLRDAVRRDGFDARRAGLAQVVEAGLLFARSRGLPDVKNSGIEGTANIPDRLATAPDEDRVGGVGLSRANGRKDLDRDLSECDVSLFLVLSEARLHLHGPLFEVHVSPRQRGDFAQEHTRVDREADEGIDPRRQERVHLD